MILPVGSARAETTFTDIGAIFADHCVTRHAGDGAPIGLDLSSCASALSGSWSGAVIEAGNPDSPFLRRMRGEDTPCMPFDGPPWSPEDDIRRIRDWIDQEARDADGRPASIQTGAEIRIHGILTGGSEIDNAAIVVTGGTRIDDRPRIDDWPRIGGEAEMRGVVQGDGTVRATRLRDR